jgi:hypothetical protein
MFAKTVDCQSRLSRSLFRIAARHHGSASYASRGRRPGPSGVGGDGWSVYDDFAFIDSAAFGVSSLGARGAFIVAFPLAKGTEISGLDISYFVLIDFASKLVFVVWICPMTYTYFGSVLPFFCDQMELMQLVICTVL